MVGLSLSIVVSPGGIGSGWIQAWRRCRDSCGRAIEPADVATYNADDVTDRPSWWMRVLLATASEQFACDYTVHFPYRVQSANVPDNDISKDRTTVSWRFTGRSFVGGGQLMEAVLEGPPKNDLARLTPSGVGHPAQDGNAAEVAQSLAWESVRVDHPMLPTIRATIAAVIGGRSRAALSPQSTWKPCARRASVRTASPHTPQGAAARASPARWPRCRVCAASPQEQPLPCPARAHQQ